MAGFYRGSGYGDNSMKARQYTGNLVLAAFDKGVHIGNLRFVGLLPVMILDLSVLVLAMPGWVMERFVTERCRAA